MQNGIKACFYCTLGVIRDSAASRCHHDEDRYRYADRLPSQSRTAHCVTWWERTFPIISALAASGRPEEDVAANSPPGFNLCSLALHKSTPSDAVVYISSIFAGLAAILEKEMFWEECTS